MTRSTPTHLRELPARPEPDTEDEEINEKDFEDETWRWSSNPSNKGKEKSDAANNNQDQDNAPLAANRPNETFRPKAFARPFCRFLSKNPTSCHAVRSLRERLQENHFMELTERHGWALEPGGKYFVERNGSMLMAFAVGQKYTSGNGVAIVSTGIDSHSTKLDNQPGLPSKNGMLQLDVDSAHSLNSSWWDRDLSIAGRVWVKAPATGEISIRLVDLEFPVARIPSSVGCLNSHDQTQYNDLDRMVPVFGLTGWGAARGQGNRHKDKKQKTTSSAGFDTFVASQPPQLVAAVASKLDIHNHSEIINWDLEFYDTQNANLGGIDRDFVFGPRIDEMLCPWAAVEALLGSSHESGDGQSASSSDSCSIIKAVVLMDRYELPSYETSPGGPTTGTFFISRTIQRVLDSFSRWGANTTASTFEKSFLLAASTTETGNPNFDGEGEDADEADPVLNRGPAVGYRARNPNVIRPGMAENYLRWIADKASCPKLQVASQPTRGFNIANALNVMAVDIGIPQLSKHSIRSMVGSKDPGLAVKLFKGFFDFYEEADAERTP